MRRLSSRTRLAGVLVVGLLALAVGVSQGLAGARGSSTAKAPIVYHDDHCGDSTGTNYTGIASFSRQGSTLRVGVEMHGMDPGIHHLILYANPGCANLVDLGKFKVDASGDGEKVAQTSTFGYKRFFVVVRGPAYDSNSTEVKLG